MITEAGKLMYSNSFMQDLMVKKNLNANIHESPLANPDNTMTILEEIKRNDSDITLSSQILSQEIVNTKQEKYVIPTDKKPIPLSVSITSTQDYNQGSVHKLCVIQDQTIYEELETSRIETKCQKSVFAMVNHELRNPLHGILGIFEIIQKADVGNEIKQHCRIGISTGNLMLLLVNDILDISQLDSCKFKLTETSFEIEEAILECVEIMKYRYEQKGITLRWKIKNKAKIVNDKNRFKQIVINLLSNSLKFTKEGYVKVTSWYDENTQQLFTKVKDTGEGIKKEEQNKIFTMYCKLEKQKTANPTGIGLGLSICQKLCEAMSGSISFSSIYGQGTVFSFNIKDLMVKNSDTPEKSNKSVIYPPSLNNSAENLSKNSILVVDDDPVCGLVLANYCKTVGVNAEIVINLIFIH